MYCLVALFAQPDDLCLNPFSWNAFVSIFWQQTNYALHELKRSNTLLNLVKVGRGEQGSSHYMNKSPKVAVIAPLRSSPAPGGKWYFPGKKGRDLGKLWSPSAPIIAQACLLFGQIMETNNSYHPLITVSGWPRSIISQWSDQRNGFEKNTSPQNDDPLAHHKV